MQYLVYSKYCKHCLQLINDLEKIPEVGNYLTPMCVDPNGSNISTNFLELQNYLKEKGVPQVTKVPTIILGNENEIVVLSGSDAFKWVDNVFSNQKNNVNQDTRIKQDQNIQPQLNRVPEQELEGINPNEMMSFSDSYSMLNSDSVSNQSFQFIDRQLQSIPTLEEQIVGNKEKFCQEKYEELLKERERM